MSYESVNTLVLHSCVANIKHKNSLQQPSL